MVDLAIEQAANKWPMPDRDWKSALSQFMVLYEDRFPINFNCGLHGIIYTLSDDNNFLLSHNQSIKIDFLNPAKFIKVDRKVSGRRLKKLTAPV